MDEKGARDLEDGIGFSLAPGRIYAGQAGATAWPSGTVRMATLASRIGGNHIRGNVRGSTFRLTLAAALLRSLGFRAAGPRKLEDRSEKALSEWIAAHLEVAVYPFPDRDTLANLENRVLAVLDPPLNIDGMNLTKVRSKLTELRRRITVPRHQENVSPRRGRRATKSFLATPDSLSARSGTGGVTLHEEIADLLQEYNNRWMTTGELANLVNARGRYRKRDGTLVTAFQIHGRTRNNALLFERRGSSVRLRGQGGGTP